MTRACRAFGILLLYRYSSILEYNFTCDPSRSAGWRACVADKQISDNKQQIWGMGVGTAELLSAEELRPRTGRPGVKKFSRAASLSSFWIL